VGINATSVPASVRFDRPFLFVIRERLSGIVVFMGKIVRMPRRGSRATLLSTMEPCVARPPRRSDTQ
jgi:hypothetical protein